MSHGSSPFFCVSFHLHERGGRQGLKKKEVIEQISDDMSNVRRKNNTRRC
jgi:hypothetical protein